MSKRISLNTQSCVEQCKSWKKKKHKIFNAEQRRIGGVTSWFVKYRVHNVHIHSAFSHAREKMWPSEEKFFFSFSFTKMPPIYIWELFFPIRGKFKMLVNEQKCGFEMRGFGMLDCFVCRSKLNIGLSLFRVIRNYHSFYLLILYAQ